MTRFLHVRRREGPLSFLSYRQLDLVNLSDFDDFSELVDQSVPPPLARVVPALPRAERGGMSCNSEGTTWASPVAEHLR
jgi:hypothetical protein